MSLTLDPEVGSALQAMMEGQEFVPPALGDVASRRAMLDGLQAYQNSIAATSEDVSHTEYTITTTDGHKLVFRWYTKIKPKSEKSAAVVYLHGGGLIMGLVENYHNKIARYVSVTGVPFLMVDYRLAPETQYPVPLEDCYAGLTWLHDNAEKLNVDTSRIAVMGDSAGGGLAACLAQLALSKNGPPISKQILLYPMLDDRTVVEDPMLAPMATWSHVDNATGWNAYLGDLSGTDKVPSTAAAARAVDAAGLPELYIDVGELDCYREENIAYAQKHIVAGISTELHIHPKVPHAWDALAPAAESSKRVLVDRYRVVAAL
jgi:acetyl esterase/lipase